MDLKYIGKNIPRIDAKKKVTGNAVYTADMKLPGMLYGKIKTSPHPFARIISINTELAVRLPGVRAVITARSVEQSPFGAKVPDELALADEYVRYIGDAVAAVAATDPDIAEEAIDLIEVKYQELDPVFDVRKAMEPGAPAIHPERAEVKNNITYHVEFTRGFGEEGFKQADLVVEDTFSTQTVNATPMETQATIASWDADGRLTLWAATQSVHNTRRVVAMGLGIPESRIVVHQPYIGGGFGTKIWLLTHHLIAAHLAKAAGRPVKLVFSREEDFISGRPRIPEIIDLRMGFKKDGTLIAKSSVITADCGAYTGLCPSIVLMSATRPDCVYRLPNIKCIVNLAYTNTIPRGSYRGFGNPQMQFAIESLMDMAAEKLGIDPINIRLKNSVQKGDTTVHGWILNSCRLTDTINLARKVSDWDKKRGEKREHRGLGIACQAHVAGNRVMHPLYDGSAALINIDQFGKARIVSGESEIGQGMNTIFTQIAAEALGMDIEDVDIDDMPDTNGVAFCTGTLADRVTVLGGNAVLKAALDAKRQLLEYASKKLGVHQDTLELADSRFRIKGSKIEVTLREVAHDTIFRELGGAPITGRGDYTVPSYVTPPDINAYGNISLGYTFGAAVAEVSVDIDTGKVTVLDVWFPMDIGKAINPKLCEGQVEGGVAQGIGYALSENCVLDATGRLLNPSFTDYKVPLCAETPRLHCYFVEDPNPGSPYGAKGAAEPIINPIAPAIVNAVYNAVGIRIKDLPITPEKVLYALKEKKSSQKNGE